MSQFNYNDYQKVVNKAQSAPTTNSVKIGFFKLKDGEEALVRILCTSLDDLKFATVHKPVFGKKFEGLGSGFTPVSCLNEVGSYSDTCPFCKAAAEGHESIAKAVKNVYVQMLVSYKDATTGSFSAAVPVVWERPAGFSKELAAKLRDYGDLSAHVFKVTRIGAGKDTKYSLDYIPLYDKPETVTTDFSAFNNFSINKHSYWEKSAADLQAYVDTGVFPTTEGKSATAESKNLDKVITTPAEEKKVEEALGFNSGAASNPAPVHPGVANDLPFDTKPTPAPAPAGTDTGDRPVRDFKGFSF